MTRSEALAKRAVKKAKRADNASFQASVKRQTAGGTFALQASGAVIGALTPKRPRKAKKKRSPTLSKLKKLLWEEVRHAVYAESPDRCLSCGSDAPPVACHITPSGDGAVIRFFLPAIYRGCRSCNDDERRHRGRWRGKFEDIFGKDYVDALYLMAEEESRKGPADKFQLKKWWVLEQTDRIKKLRQAAAI